MRYFKTLIIPVIALFAILAFNTNDVADAVVENGDKTRICHFGGHDGDFPARGPRNRDRCLESDGGRLIRINDNALPAHGL